MISKSFWRAARLCLVLAGVGTLGACATLVSGTSQNISVATEPDGAVCDLNRAGQTIGVINPAPGTVRIDRGKNDVLVTCKKDGFVDQAETLPAGFTGTTVGNVIAGGLIGIAVDAASGANYKYPESILVILTPAQFASPQARDEHFAKLRERITQRSVEAATKIKTECSQQSQDLCRDDVKKVEEQRDKDLAALEQRRLAAKVAG